MSSSDVTVRHANATANTVAETYINLHGVSPTLFRAPGRVNLIGEHTDYNDGFVLPAAIDFYAYVAAGPSGDDRLHIHSLNLDESRDFELANISFGPTQHWSDYVRGVAASLQESGCNLRGANLVIKSEVPIGSGLSSSAALEVSTAVALLAVSGLTLDRLTIARACQRAENKYTGAQCGIMDQFIACFGQKDHAVLIDCRSFEATPVPLEGDVRVVICNTNVKHNLAGGEYNLRRAACESSVRKLQKFYPNIRALRDVTPEQLEEHRNELSDLEYRRCRHVVTEDPRVLDAVAALRSDDLTQFGKLMYDSHRSLRDDYEVSCKELDVLVELASGFEGVLGARMTGGGFGGCTVNLVRTDAVNAFSQFIAREYESRTGIRPDVYCTVAAEGAGRVE